MRGGIFAVFTTAAMVGLVGCGQSTQTLRPAASPGSATSPDGVPISERTFQGMTPLACGGIGPLSLYTQPGGAQNANTPAAAGLRYVFKHDPTGGESPQTPNDWVLMNQTKTTAEYGQRTGVVGILATVSLKLQGNRYVWSGSGGCGPIGYPDGRNSSDPSVKSVGPGRSLTLAYSPLGCINKPKPAFVVHETKTAVDVEQVDPTQAAVAGPPGTFEGCGGTTAYKTVHLRQPVGARTIRNIGYVPARVLSPPKSTDRK